MSRYEYSGCNIKNEIHQYFHIYVFSSINSMPHQNFFGGVRRILSNLVIRKTFHTELICWWIPQSFIILNRKFQINRKTRSFEAFWHVRNFDRKIRKIPKRFRLQDYLGISIFTGTLVQTSELIIPSIDETMLKCASFECNEFPLFLEQSWRFLFNIWSGL